MKVVTKAKISVFINKTRTKIKSAAWEIKFTVIYPPVYRETITKVAVANPPVFILKVRRGIIQR